eukprot:gene31867-7074_t
MANIQKQLFNSLIVIEKAGIKPPWKVMGCWSNPDFLPFMPTGNEYRKFSPGNPPVKAIIPHNDGNCYDIKYYNKDFRRAGTFAARTVDTSPFDFEKMFAAFPTKPEDLKEVARPEFMPTRGH